MLIGIEHLCRRQSEIEDKLDLTKNQAPSQADATTADEVQEKTTERQTPSERVRHLNRSSLRV